MKRLTDYAFNDAITVALNSMPPGIRARVEHTDYFCGASPVFAGLHNYQDTGDGRPYSQTAHAVWLMHQRLLPRTLRGPTVVLPVLVRPKTVAHELGHVLHELIGFEYWPTPVTRYAQKNKWEAFAEAFTAWLGWYGEEIKHSIDEKTVALFGYLAGAR
jgi:hypothetical protein